MAHNRCSDCQYFRQHYCIEGRRFVPLYCGHCTFSYSVQRYPGAKACRHFLPNPH